MKKFISPALFFIIRTIGNALGFYSENKINGRPHEWLSLIGNVSLKGNDAIRQYKYGTYQEAREALLEYINKLEELNGNPEYRDSRILSTELAFSLTRLSLLEEINGYKDNANETMERALEVAMLNGLKNKTKQKLIASVERIDKYLPTVK